MILHIPHASMNVLDKSFCCDIDVELLRMTDRYTDELFEYSSATRIVASISRLICDVERFEDDDVEVMAAKGMGVCYTVNSFGTKLRDISSKEKADIIERYYHPHHKVLEEAVQRELEMNKYALIIDCHSFSNSPLPHESDKISARPDICIGSDLYHTPQWLIETVAMGFLDQGYSVKLNSPFEGTLVPMKFYQKNADVLSVMVELNRDLYMNQKGQKNENALKVKSDIESVLSRVMEKYNIMHTHLV